MSFLDEVRDDRQPLAHVLKKHRGIRKIVEDLYPDRAHFIYELLQNAEDAGATDASFLLDDNSVAFEHNGRAFTENDVWAITDIGEGTKADKEDKIGRFGVGFKAVFAYTETPHIWSPTFSFKISDLVLPSAIPDRPNLGPNTRFEFPFNNSKKTDHIARAEVEAGLNDLAETTLLFLSHLSSIRWQIGRKGSGEVLRKQHTEHHIQVVKRAADQAASNSHFLVFSEAVKGLPKQNLSVAYLLEFLPSISAFEPRMPLVKQLKIAPANPGRVAVFFPADKEASGLRFHLHAPFVPELSRASIKETPVNEPLFKQLTELVAKSLHHIRDMELLTGEFLGVLPNPQDTLPSRYQPFRSVIVEEMNCKPLTPTQLKSHAPATHLLQAKAALKDLIMVDDLRCLVKDSHKTPQWAIGATQKNSSTDRFLSGLAIRVWDIEQIVQTLSVLSSYGVHTQTDKDVIRWYTEKPIEWHQQFYALLYKELALSHEVYRLKHLKIVRLANGTFSVGSQCYFPSDGVEHDDVLPRVAKGAYTSGKSKTQQDDAKKLLVEIGVSEVGETEQVRAILKQRYTFAAPVQEAKTYEADLKRFIAFVGANKDQASLFEDAFIFVCADAKWRQPAGVYLDSPFMDTNLGAYYAAIGEDGKRVALAPRYANMDIPIEKIRKFAEAIGAQTRLQITKINTNTHPQRDALRADWYRPGSRWTASAIDEDWIIPHLKKALVTPSEVLSRLVWNTMRTATLEMLKARYRPNQQYATREADSSLVLILRQTAWIPQKNRPFVKPAQALRDLLPKGFPFDTGEPWLEAIHFGEEEEKQSEEHAQKQAAAKQLGFTDAHTLKRALQFAALPPAEQERVLAECQRTTPTELPEHESGNPDRRAAGVAKQAADAPEKTTEERRRSVSVGRELVKQETVEYLREQYTNSDGEMICQICKAPLPFKLADGSYYLEKVEFIEDLKKRHHQNYLALCPNHAAMYQHANGSRNSIKTLFVKMEDQQFAIVLAQTDATIYFTSTHAADLRTIIKVEETDCPSVNANL